MTLVFGMYIIINYLGLCIRVEVNNLVIMEFNQFVYRIIGWELNKIANKLLI
jgi:hypothetical protein